MKPSKLFYNALAKKLHKPDWAPDNDDFSKLVWWESMPEKLKNNPYTDQTLISSAELMYYNKLRFIDLKDFFYLEINK